MNTNQLVDMLTAKLDDAVYSVVVEGCLMIENEAKQRCPVDTGILRNSITHEVERENGKIRGTVGTNLDYAPYVEFGTGLFAEAGDGRKTRWSYQDSKGEWHSTLGQKPQPYLRPAYQVCKPAIQRKLQQAITGVTKNG